MVEKTMKQISSMCDTMLLKDCMYENVTQLLEDRVETGRLGSDTIYMLEVKLDKHIKFLLVCPEKNYNVKVNIGESHLTVGIVLKDEIVNMFKGQLKEILKKFPEFTFDQVDLQKIYIRLVELGYQTPISLDWEDRRITINNNPILLKHVGSIFQTERYKTPMGLIITEGVGGIGKLFTRILQINHRQKMEQVNRHRSSLQLSAIRGQEAKKVLDTLNKDNIVKNLGSNLNYNEIIRAALVMPEYGKTIEHSLEKYSNHEDIIVASIVQSLQTLLFNLYKGN